jgi:hypothetical protein
MGDPIDVPINKMLKALKEIDPELRKAFVRDAKAVAKPVEAEIKSAIPHVAPLSGMNNRGRLGWGMGKKADSTTIQFKASGSRRSEVTPLVKIRVNSAATVMADMSGRKANGNDARGRVMIRMLNARVRRASRYVYPAGEKAQPEAEKQIKAIIDKVALLFSRKSL